MRHLVLLAALLLFSVSCGEPRRRSSARSAPESECRSSYECVNGDCRCTNTGRSGDPCTSSASCEDECRLCDGMIDGGSNDTGSNVSNDAGSNVPNDAGMISTCWSECNTDHGTCADRCGPGLECWNECNTDHGTCADRCGPGLECWSECNTDHGTCADRCGPGAECWGACNTDHGTCADRCGPGAECWSRCTTDHATCVDRCGP